MPNKIHFIPNRTAVNIPDPCVIGLIGHDKSICDLTRELVRNNFQIGGIQTFSREIHKKDIDEWTGYLLERGLYESVFECARENNLDILEVNNSNDLSSVEWFLRKNVNLIISCGCRWVLRKAFLERFNFMVVNLHPAILPEYGGGPVQTWQVLNSEKKGGWTAHWIDVGIDRGDIICQIKYRVHPNASPIEILRLRHKHSRVFFKKLIDLLKARRLPKIKVDLRRRLYFHGLYTPEDARIDFSWDAESIERFVRAFGFPYVGAFGFYRKSSGEIIRVHISKVEPVKSTRKTFHPFAMGNIMNYTEDGGVLVNLREGLIKISMVRDGYREIQASGTLKLGGKFLNDHGGNF